MAAVTGSGDFLISSNPNDALLFSVKYVVSFCLCYYDQWTFFLEKQPFADWL